VDGALPFFIPKNAEAIRPLGDDRPAPRHLAVMGDKMRWAGVDIRGNGLDILRGYKHAAIPFATFAALLTFKEDRGFQFHLMV